MKEMAGTEVAPPRVSRGRSALAVMKTQLPVAHAVAELPPVCAKCAQKGTDSIDPGCADCWEIIADPETSVAQLFAVLRQWTPRAQAFIDDVAKQILCRGGHLDDRDGMTGMTLLHFAARAGADGYADPRRAARLAASLVLLGASADVHSEWTGMTPLHIAAHYGCDAVVATLLEGRTRASVDAVAHGLDEATPLHLACQAHHATIVEILIAHNANPTLRDAHGRTPLDSIALADDDDSVAVGAPGLTPLARIRQALEGAGMRFRDAAISHADSGGRAELAAMEDTGAVDAPNRGGREDGSRAAHAQDRRRETSVDVSRRRDVADDDRGQKRAIGGRSMSVRFDDSVLVRTRTLSDSTQDSDGRDGEGAGRKMQADAGAAAERKDTASTARDLRTASMARSQTVASDALAAPRAVANTHGMKDAAHWRSNSISDVGHLRHAGRYDGLRGHVSHEGDAVHGDGFATPPGHSEGRRTSLSDPLIAAMLSPRLRARLAEARSQQQQQQQSSAQSSKEQSEEKRGAPQVLPTNDRFGDGAPPNHAYSPTVEQKTLGAIGDNSHYAPLAHHTHSNPLPADHERNEAYRRKTSSAPSAPAITAVAETPPVHADIPTVVTVDLERVAVQTDDTLALGTGSDAGSPHISPRPSRRRDVRERREHSAETSVDASGGHVSSALRRASLAAGAAERVHAATTSSSIGDGGHLHVAGLAPNPPLSRGGSSNTLGGAPQSPRATREKEQLPDLREGQNVSVGGEVGVIKYIGLVDFAKGLWVGVVLRKPVGKNNGSVNGRQYFACKPNHGVFVKYSDKIVPITESK